MKDAKQIIDSLLLQIKKGEIDPKEAWYRIEKLKELYVEQYSEQSWHVYIGNKFQQLVYSIIKSYFHRLKSQNAAFQNLDIFTETEVKNNEKLHENSLLSMDNTFYFQILIWQ